MPGQDHMHNPERQRSTFRAPVHHVHSLVPGGKPGDRSMAVMTGDSMPERFIGNWGSISIDTINQLLRIHDDITPGGSMVAPMFNPSILFAPMWPFMPLQWGPLAFAANEIKQFDAPFDRFPVVFAVDAATGKQVIVDITYELGPDGYANKFSVSPSIACTLYVIAQ